jgi:hypothetical protein
LPEGLEGCYQKLSPDDSKSLNLNEELAKLRTELNHTAASDAEGNKLMIEDITTKEKELKALRAATVLNCDELTASAYSYVLDKFKDLHELKGHMKQVKRRLQRSSLCGKAGHGDGIVSRLEKNIVVKKATAQLSSVLAMCWMDCSCASSQRCGAGSRP